MVDTSHPAHHAGLRDRSVTQTPLSFHLDRWHVADGLPGCSAILQSLLWPMSMDPDRQCYVPGLIKHLSRRIIQAPDVALYLRGDLFWLPVAVKWQFVQAVHPTTLLRILLETFSASLDTGEWGLHLETADLDLQAAHRSRVMLIPLCVRPEPLSLQELVDAWEHSIGRPRLHGCAEIVYLSLELPCIRVQGSCDAQWPYIRPHPMTGSQVWLPSFSPYGTFTHYIYEVRTLLYRARSAAKDSSSIALHWCGQNRTHAPLPEATTHQLCIIALRATGQVESRENENVTTQI